MTMILAMGFGIVALLTSLHVSTILPGIRAARQQGQYRKMVFLDLGNIMVMGYGLAVLLVLGIDRMMSSEHPEEMGQPISTSTAVPLVAVYIAAYLILVFLSWKAIARQRRSKAVL